MNFLPSLLPVRKLSFLSSLCLLVFIPVLLLLLFFLSLIFVYLSFFPYFLSPASFVFPPFLIPEFPRFYHFFSLLLFSLSSFTLFPFLVHQFPSSSFLLFPFLLLAFLPLLSTLLLPFSSCLLPSPHFLVFLYLCFFPCLYLCLSFLSLDSLYLLFIYLFIF